MVAVANVVTQQYPHYLYRRDSDGEAVQNEKGSWEEQPGAWTLHSRCREETNGKGTQIQAADGKFVAFSSLIHAPQGTQRIPEGVEVAVTDAPLTDPDAELDQDGMEEAVLSGKVRVTGVCLKFDKGRLHSRLWV